MCMVACQSLNLSLACISVLKWQELQHLLQVEGLSPVNVFSCFFFKNQIPDLLSGYISSTIVFVSKD